MRLFVRNTQSDTNRGANCHMQNDAMQSEQVGTDTVHPEFVPVLFATEMEHARRIKRLLENNNIPTMLDHDLSGEVAYTVLPRGIGVLVPDQMHTLASEIIASDEGDDGMEVAAGEDDMDEGDVAFDSDLDDDDMPGDDDLDDDDDDLGNLDDLDDDYDTDVVPEDDDI